MKLSVTFVPVRKIKPSASRWNFSDDEIDKAARFIAEAKGMVQPIVLQREEGFESYTVIEGDFEYYAAAKASEWEPQTCDVIPAFVVESPDDAEIIQQQIQLFRTQRSTLKPTFNSINHDQQIASRLNEIETQQVNLELRQAILEQQEIQEIKKQLDDLKQQICPRTICPRTNLLNLFNVSTHAELLHQMKRAGLIGKNAEKIVETIEYERQYRLFESLRDVVTRVKGLTYEKMVDLVEGE
jgi:hypothetical protein